MNRIYHISHIYVKLLFCNLRINYKKTPDQKNKLFNDRGILSKLRLEKAEIRQFLVYFSIILEKEFEAGITRLLFFVPKSPICPSGQRRHFGCAQEPQI